MTAPGPSTLLIRFAVFALLCIPMKVAAQASALHPRHYSDFWSGVNIDLKLDHRWTVFTEGELKRREFMAKPYGEFVCLGVQYRVVKGFHAHVAIGRQWVVEEEVYSLVVVGETRLQVQGVLHQTTGRFRFRERLRNEFRWVDRLPSDPAPGKEFHDRLRIQLGMEYRIFENKRMPSFVVSDEYLAETINGFSHPAFNQNRIFIGLRQPIGSALSAEAGYLNVYARSGTPWISEWHDVLKVGLSWSPALHGRTAEN